LDILIVIEQNTLITAINIKTEIWNDAVKLLVDQQWIVVYKYDLFDAGIDFDLIVFEKDGEYVLFAWDNWMAGEIQAEEVRMKEIEQHLSVTFERGEPLNLKETVFSLFWTK
jgi:hypothetical protein